MTRKQREEWLNYLDSLNFGLVALVDEEDDPDEDLEDGDEWPRGCPDDDDDYDDEEEGEDDEEWEDDDLDNEEEWDEDLDDE